MFTFAPTPFPDPQSSILELSNTHRYFRYSCKMFALIVQLSGSSCLFIDTGLPRGFPLCIRHHTHFHFHNSNKLSLVHLTISIKVVSSLLFWQTNYRHSRSGWFFSMSLNWYLLVRSITDIIVSCRWRFASVNRGFR